MEFKQYDNSYNIVYRKYFSLLEVQQQLLNQNLKPKQFRMKICYLNFEIINDGDSAQIEKENHPIYSRYRYYICVCTFIRQTIVSFGTKKIYISKFSFEKLLVYILQNLFMLQSSLETIKLQK